MKHPMEQVMDEPLYARVGRQVPLHGTLVPLHREPPAPQNPRRPRRMTIAMATLALAGLIALGAQLVHAATRPAPARTQTNTQNVGAELAAALHSRAAPSPAADTTWSSVTRNPRRTTVDCTSPQQN